MKELEALRLKIDRLIQFYQMSSNFPIVSYLEKQEFLLTLIELKGCTKDTEFKDVLAKRWERIRGRSTSYTDLPFNDVNLLCLDIAKELSPLSKDSDEIDDLALGEGPYFVLMPSLKACSDLTGTNIHNYRPNEFILADGEERYIPIKECLEYGFKQDRGFSHLVAIPP